MSQRILFYVMVMMTYLFYSCNKDDDLNLKNESANLVQEQVDILSDEEISNYLDQNYIYSVNPSMIRKREDASRGGTFIADFKAYLKANPKGLSNFEKKYGNIAWDYADVAADESYGIFPVIKNKDTKVSSLLIVAVEKNKIKMIIRDRKDALKAKSFKDIKGKHEKNQFPKDLLVYGFLYTDKVIFDYVDCEMIQAQKSLNGIIEDRGGDRECHFLTTAVVSANWSQGWTAQYGHNDPQLNYIDIYQFYIFYCDGINVGTESGFGGVTGVTGGTVPVTNPDPLPCLKDCPCHSTQSVLNLVNLYLKPDSWFDWRSGGQFVVDLLYDHLTCPSFGVQEFWSNTQSVLNEGWLLLNNNQYQSVSDAIHDKASRYVYRRVNASGNYTIKYDGWNLGSVEVGTSLGIGLSTNTVIGETTYQDFWHVYAYEIGSRY